MDRRTFLKLSAGVLALAAAGGLTGCGGTTDKSVRVTIKPTDITGVFTDAQGNRYLMDFNNRPLTVEPHGYVRYNGTGFGLDSENTVPGKNWEGSYELRVKYNGKTAVFRCDGSGKNVTPSVE